MDSILKPRIISVGRRKAIRHDTRTTTQIDARIHARKSVLGRPVSDRPIVRRSAAQVDLRIAKHEKALRMKHRPEVSGA
jgi:hypothetical protein